MNNLLILLTCLIGTIVIELIIGIILGINNKKDILTIILVNVITNPIVVFVPRIIYKYYGYKEEIIVLVFLEILTILFEGYIYHTRFKYKKLNPYFISLLLNLISYFMGEFIKML